MSNFNKLLYKRTIITILGFAFVLFIHGAVPFLMLPTLGQAIWTTGFSESMANNASIFDFYARDFGIPKPAAIAFGLAGSWPASLLIRMGLHAADAYAAMAALWLCLAMYSAYRVTRFFGGKMSIALIGAVTWMTMPVIWAHASYSMLSLGIALLSFYFLSVLRLLSITPDKLLVTVFSVGLYALAAIVAVFMDGYTFMMFATGASILLAYAIVTKPDARKNLFKLVVPVHILSFALAYLLFSLYIGKSNFDAHELDFFRGWGLDLSFLVVPTQGLLWLPDLLGLSIARSDEIFFGDASTWVTTFALPVLILGLLAWYRARSTNSLSTGIFLVAIFGFYMALGPSVKINSTKPYALQISHPGQQSNLMASEYAIAPTGNAWISETLPGFNVMRASYRWSALGIFALWLLVMMNVAKADKKYLKIWSGLLLFIVIFNLPDFEDHWQNSTGHRTQFFQIDEELVSTLSEAIKKDETVVFLPWGNDFIANYLAPKVGFRTFNVGGDKNLAAAQTGWSENILNISTDEELNKIYSLISILLDGNVDVIVIPYFHMLFSPHFWPCVQISNNPLCPEERKKDIYPIISTIRNSSFLQVTDSTLFSTVRLSSEFSGTVGREKLLNNIINDIKYPFSITSTSLNNNLILKNGWHSTEENHVWSSSNAELLLPSPINCLPANYKVKLTFGVFGASPERPVEIMFNSADSTWQWAKEIKAVSADTLSVEVPLHGAINYRKIKISVPNATSPNNLTGSGDSRILGISLQRLELLDQSRFVEEIRYPLVITPNFVAAPYVLQQGWHDLEKHHIWSDSTASMLLPIPKKCVGQKCIMKMNFGVFGANPNRPVDVLFSSADLTWQWSPKITAQSGETMSLDVPLVGANGYRQININVPNATSPKELTGSPDGRILGISLQSIELVNP
jgi:hypothetical protein